MLYFTIKYMLKQANVLVKLTILESSQSFLSPRLTWFWLEPSPKHQTNQS